MYGFPGFLNRHVHRALRAPVPTSSLRPAPVEKENAKKGRKKKGKK